MASLYSSPPKRPAPTPAASTILRQDAFRASSPPRTPQNRRAQGMRSHTAPRVSTRTSKRETFLDDLTPLDGVRVDDGGEERDPHDLRFSPKHVTRASVVDNMLMALDQFSNPTPSNVASREPPNAGLRYNSIIGRRRANTFSSDVSSDNESKSDESIPPESFQRSRRSNSNSTFRFPRGLETVPSLYEEEEPQTRNRVFDSQRAFATLDQRNITQSRSGRRSGRSSGSSSVDIGQALSGGKLGPAGNRRSQSFDFGSSRRGFPILENDTPVTSRVYNLADEVEAAPTPIVHAGPRRRHSPIRHNPTTPLSPIYDPALLTRRNSTKSSRSQCAQKGRAGTMSVAGEKSKDESRDHYDNLENLPPMPTYFPLPHQNPVLAADKASQGSSADPLQVLKERPGFFRRVFGSKNASATTLQGTESESGVSHEATTKSPTDDSFRTNAAAPKLHKLPPKDINSTSPAAPKEQQTIAKKSSAFFRRRKKSASEPLLNPLPLSLHPAKTEAAEPSPVSSLRQVMGPYLAGPPLPSPKFGLRNESPQGFNTAHTSLSRPNDTSSATDEKEKSSSRHLGQTAPKALTPESKYSTSLKVPQQDNQDSTFLADSSGTEEPIARSRQNTPSQSSDGNSRISPSDKSHGQLSGGSLTVRFPFTSATSSRVATPSSGSRTPNSPSSPTLPTSTMASKTASPSHLRLQRDASDNSRQGSLSKDHAVGDSPLPSGSDLSIYKSAPSTPFAAHYEGGSNEDGHAPAVKITASPEAAPSRASDENDREQALRIFENRDENLEPGEVSAWLGDAGDARERVRVAFMTLFDWTYVDILSALRGLCARIALKGETQQVDRMLDEFSKRWCECNCNHGFKSSDVVHTICYSILLLNTDLHLADIGQKMTRTQFIRNTLPTIRRIASDSAFEGTTTIRAGTWPKPDPHAVGNNSPLPRSPTLPVESQGRRNSIDEAIPVIGSARSTERLMRESFADVDSCPSDPGPLVTTPFIGSIRAWESQVENVLKRIYTSIARERLPLFGAKAETLDAPPQPVGNFLNITGNMLRRSPSTLSKAASEHSRGKGGENRLGGGRWLSKTRSRPQLHPVSNHGSTRTSMDEGSSAWSPSLSSTWSKASLGKTPTSMSVDSLGSGGMHGDYQKSIGFANALSQAIIREDSSGIFGNHDEGMKTVPLLDDESLELSGAPWAKEGSLKHKHHLDGVDKRAKGRNWNDCFAVIEKGWLRLFSFSINAKSLRIKAKDRAKSGGVVGGGNWMDSAEEVWKFLLRQSIASALPDPGYSKARPYVWALSLPTGAVHLFQVGTPDIIKEFVSTANYWSARLSKEPMMGGISNMEFGWSDAVLNRALISSESHPNMPAGGSSRPSMQSSLRSSFDQVSGGMRPKRPVDKMTISEWCPPQQSMMASQLMEVDQLRNLQAYIQNVETELGKHNELRPAMQLALPTRHPNTSKAMANWEKKSSYLLREIVKFKTYVDSLLLAQKEKEKVLRMRAQDK